MADELQIPDSEAPISKPKTKTSIWTKLFSILIVVLMASWAVAMYEGKDSANGTDEDKPDFEVNGYSFYIMQDGSFATFVDMNNQQTPVAFRLDPRNASNVSLAADVVSDLLKASKVYVATSPNQTDLGKVAVASAEIGRITSLYGIQTLGAYTEEANPSDPNVPIRTCNDSKSGTKVVYLYVGNETGITNVNGCIHVSGMNADDLILAADKLGYNLLGIKV